MSTKYHESYSKINFLCSTISTQGKSSLLSTIIHTTGSLNPTESLMETTTGKSQEETSSGIINSTAVIFSTDIFATNQSPITSLENSSPMQNNPNTPSSILFSTLTATDITSAPQSEKYPAFPGVTR